METVAITLALTIVAFFALAFVVVAVWSRTDSYKQHLRFKAYRNAARRGLSPIIED